MNPHQSIWLVGTLLGSKDEGSKSNYMVESFDNPLKLPFGQIATDTGYHCDHEHDAFVGILDRFSRGIHMCGTNENLGVEPEPSIVPGSTIPDHIICNEGR